QLAVIVGVAEDLQIEQAHLVAGRADGRGHALEPDRLESQEDLRVHQRARVDEQHFHGRLLYAAARKRPLRERDGAQHARALAQRARSATADARPSRQPPWYGQAPANESAGSRGMSTWPISGCTSPCSGRPFTMAPPPMPVPTVR